MVLLMKILVCVKQVPEAESPILIDDQQDCIQLDAITEYKMNRLDEFAVEEAVRIKESFSAVFIHAMTVGPERCTEVLRRSMGMGADEGIHIACSGESYRSSAEIAALIADWAQNQHYNLILTGAMSEDNMQGQVGPMIAARLGLPWATAVVFEKMMPDQKSIYVEREIDGGSRDMLELSLPAVLSLQSGINRPRYPSLSNLLRANQQALITMDTADLSVPPGLQTLAKVDYPQKIRAGKVLSGTGPQKAAELVSILRSRALL